MDAPIGDLNALIAALAKAKDLCEVEECCEQFCALTSTRWFLIGVISSRSLAAPRISICSNYPDAWLNSYLNSGRQRVDPVVAYILSENVPIIWSELTQRAGFSRHEHLSLMAEAKQHGLHDGLSVPVHTPVGDTAVFSLALAEGSPSAHQVLSQAIPYAQLYALHLLDRYLSLLQVESDNERHVELTARETECLFWACEGKTSWEIAKILGITERTVEFHLTNSAKKLNASNRQHAIALASRHGLVKPTL